MAVLFYSASLILLLSAAGHGFDIPEATIDEIHQAFNEDQLTSRKLVEFYLGQIGTLNPLLRAVIEVNPEAIDQAEDADQKRRASGGNSAGLQGIPVLLKDNIATLDGLNTTAGSFALLGSVVVQDAGVVEKLRRAGAVILGKASVSEWSNFRSRLAPTGWSARGGQGKNPYMLSRGPCGSSSGSAIAVAANLAMVSLNTETDGSIICPSTSTATVGIKPSVGLTSRAGTIMISPRMDTVGPICRTVSDAVHTLDAIVGFDDRDAEATREAESLIPRGGYKQFLKAKGLQGKRLGIVRNPFFKFPAGSIIEKTVDNHLNLLRQRGAILVDNLEIQNVKTITNPLSSGEHTLMLSDFKLSLNAYLSVLLKSPVRSLAEVIDFNNKHKDQERMDDFGQEILLAAENSTGFGEKERMAVEKMQRLSRDGFERMMKENDLDAMLTPNAKATSVLAIGGYPAISVPGGYGENGLPFGICFSGLRGSEPKLIEIAYGFEQATKIRRPPSLIDFDIVSSM